MHRNMEMTEWVKRAVQKNSQSLLGSYPLSLIWWSTVTMNLSDDPDISYQSTDDLITEHVLHKFVPRLQTDEENHTAIASDLLVLAFRKWWLILFLKNGHEMDLWLLNLKPKQSSMELPKTKQNTSGEMQHQNDMLGDFLVSNWVYSHMADN